MNDATTPGSIVRGTARGTAMRGAKQIQRDVRRMNRDGGSHFGTGGTYYRPFQEPNGTAYR